MHVYLFHMKYKDVMMMMMMMMMTIMMMIKKCFRGLVPKIPIARQTVDVDAMCTDALYMAKQFSWKPKSLIVYRIE